MKNLILFAIAFFSLVPGAMAAESAPPDSSQDYLIRTLKGHTDSIYALAFSSYSKYLASGSADTNVKVWNAESWFNMKTFTGHFGSVKSASFSPDRHYLATGSADKHVKVWDIENWDEAQTIDAHSDAVNAVRFTPDQRYLVSGSNDKSVKIWDAQSWKKVKSLSHSRGVNCAASSAGGRFLASGEADGTVKIWDLKTWDEAKTFKGYFNAVHSLAFSPDGRNLAVAGLSKSIKIFDIRSGKKTMSLGGHSAQVYSIAYSPDGRYLASGSGDGTVKIWDLASGKDVRTLRGHSGSVYAVAFSPDQKVLASGGADGVIKIWNPFMVYLKNPAVAFKDANGRVLTTLPIKTPLWIEKTENEIVRARMSNGVKGWVNIDDIAFDKPVLIKPLIHIMMENLEGSKLHVKGAVYSDAEINRVELKGQILMHANFDADKESFGDLFPFEELIDVSTVSEVTLIAENKGGNISQINFVLDRDSGTVEDYLPNVLKLVVLADSEIKKLPSTDAPTLNSVVEGDMLNSKGNKSNWILLDNGGWIPASSVQEKVDEPLPSAESEPLP